MEKLDILRWNIWRRIFNFLFIQFHFLVFHCVFLLLFATSRFSNSEYTFFWLSFWTFVRLFGAWNFSFDFFVQTTFRWHFFSLDIFCVLMEICVNIDFTRIVYCANSGKKENVRDFVCRAESKYIVVFDASLCYSWHRFVNEDNEWNPFREPDQKMQIVTSKLYLTLSGGGLEMIRFCSVGWVVLKTISQRRKWA